MEHTLKLNEGIKINGKLMHELKYDIAKIDANLFARADALRQQTLDPTKPTATMGMEVDYTMHMYLGFAAILAANEGENMDFVDLERMKGPDLVSTVNIGRVFTYGLAESLANSLENSQENTQEPSTQA